MTNIAGAYVLDATHSTIGFVARHAMVTKTRGRFDDFTSSFTFGEHSSAEATIKAASINTGNADRDAHVAGADFFNAEEFPEITFRATSFNLDEAGNGTVAGDLTIKGTTKPVTLNVESEGLAQDPYGNTRLGFEATTKIKRSEFGIDFNAPLNSGGVLISDEIKIEIEASAIKQA